MQLLRRTLPALLILCLVTRVPGSGQTMPVAAEPQPFAWNQDAYWDLLENQFRQALTFGCQGLVVTIDTTLAKLAALTDSLGARSYQPGDSIFSTIETTMFALGPEIGGCREKLPLYMAAFDRLRSAIKAQSVGWDMNRKETRIRMYRLLYGGRTAVEQVMLQLPPDSIPALSLGEAVASVTPAAKVLGVTIHSGDILLSRGGAPVSALIARGNDFQGNFSHVALVYIDSVTNEVSIIESHIERGVAIADLDEYLRDTKLRVMVLRLRPDLPAMRADPMLPHKAAAYMLGRARGEHIPYDLEMDFTDSSRMFCSEVVSQAYRHVGVTLWMGMSHISAPGLRNWLGLLGVTHFWTQEPSDLEYDPQVQVVAEWRDPATLVKDQTDNAIIDVMLESAEQGATLRCLWYMLPVAQAMRVYSIVLNWCDRVGPVPEGMSATAALRMKWFAARHAKIKEHLMPLIETFRAQNGFAPPYWELIKLARQAQGQVPPSDFCIW